MRPANKPPDAAAVNAACAALERRLLAARNDRGFWAGRLSTSALSTAVAVIALRLQRTPGEAADARECRRIEGGLRWLAEHQNADGGFGDTVRSASNISTTALCWGAFAIAGDGKSELAAAEAAVERFMASAAGSLEPERLVAAIRGRYGKDHTFSVPILTVLALAGKLGAGRTGWRRVPQLPFELAALPRGLFRKVNLQVVSYALPALIAIGRVRHHHAPSRNPLTRTLRNLTLGRTTRVLDSIQPHHGGFLEAVPLTSFVLMSLVAAGRRDSAVVRRGLEFLERSVREDGSWPIDTNLATWVTTLSVKALAPRGSLDAGDRRALRRWLLGQQYRAVHPYTGAAPGAFAWTDLPGGVPDADDTPGALLALRRLGPLDFELVNAAARAVRWLLEVQNKDGGIPTFCRGWGRLPFDRSSPDLTAHTVQAWSEWLEDLGAPLAAQTRRALGRALEFLRETQRPDGSFLPLWFGNQHVAGKENLTYGTARVVMALARSHPQLHPASVSILERGLQWLRHNQNADGGYGGGPTAPSTVEETGLALAALVAARDPGAAGTLEPCAERALAWLLAATADPDVILAAPIGFYFARLWYYEELYPWIFALEALEEVRQALCTP